MTDPLPQKTMAGRREWIGLAVLALPAMLVTMDLSVLYLAVPELSADLKPSSTELLWITDIYGFLIAGSLITMGTLGDRIGRRRLLMIGAAAFGAASILAAFSTSSGMLIAARALLGVAGATLAPSTLSLIRSMFHDPKQRTTAIGVWIASFSIGAAIGPLVGGVLLEFFWWGSVFLAAVPVMVLLLVAGPRLLPEYRDPGAGRLDLASAVLSLGGVLGVIFAVKQLAEHGWGWVPAASALAGVTLGVVFARRQRTLEHPFIDVELFKVPAFSASIAVSTIALLATFGGFYFMSQYFQLVIGMGPLEAGLWQLPTSVAFIVAAGITTVLVKRVGAAAVMAVGMLIAAAGFAVLGQADGTGFAVVIVGSILFAFGVTPVMTLATDLIVGAAPEERAGSAAAISETGNELGGALGVALLGSLGTAVYRADLGSGVPEVARDSLGGALAAGDPVTIDAARDAFVNGMEVTAYASAAVAAAAAVLVVALVRGVRPAEHGEESVHAEPAQPLAA